ncbi:MAG: agmatinase [Methanobrevibacter sp.]|jgi:agmatinase|nr:agmatinase [Candidatus Methanoflexus mossambicus]
MLFNTYEPWKFAFSQEVNNLDEVKDIVNNNNNRDNNKDNNNKDNDKDNNNYNNKDNNNKDNTTNFNENNNKSWGIVGVPFDSTSSYGTGSRYGSIAIREASFGFEKYNYNFKKELNSIFFDFGDLNVVYGNCKQTLKNLEETVNELNQLNINPIILGGEHSISLGVLKGLSNKYNLNNVVIIHFDAHMDMVDTYQGESFSHATVLRRIHELNPKEIIQIGIRSASLQEVDFLNSKENKENITVFSSKETNNNLENIKKYISSINNPIYLSIDLDVFDPAYMGDVGNPMPNGLSPSILEELMEIITQKELIGFDVVELSTKTLGNPSAVLASKLVYDFLTLI